MLQHCSSSNVHTHRQGACYNAHSDLLGLWLGPEMLLLLLRLVLGPHLSREKLEDSCGPQLEDTPKGSGDRPMC